MAESPNKSLAMVPSTSALLSAENGQTAVSPRRREDFNDVERGAPGDASLKGTAKREPEEIKRAKQKSSFYGEVFAYREPTTSLKDRVARESPVTAEIKTNVIINDEYSFLTDLTSHLAVRYSRPVSSILISLSHSSCLILGNSFDPAYLLTISAIPAHIQPTINKRNAGLLQLFLAENLGVPAHRGIVKFVPVAEENLASGGITVADRGERACKKGDVPKANEKAEADKERERERRRKTMGGPNPATPVTPTFEDHGDARSEETDHVGLLERARSRSRASEKRRSRKSSLAGSVVPENEKVPPMPPIPTEKSSLDLKAEKAQKMGKRRSLISIFSRN